MKYEFGLKYDDDFIGNRECIHVPVVVVCLQQDAYPGAKVRFLDSKCEDVVLADSGIAHGIIDPFISTPVLKTGSNVLVMLIPGLVFNIHHEYTIKTK